MSSTTRPAASHLRIWLPKNTEKTDASETKQSSIDTKERPAPNSAEIPAELETIEIESARQASRKGVRCKIANSYDDRRAAFGLVYRRYVQAGLIEPRAHRLMVTPFHLLPTTHIFIGKYSQDARIACTISLVEDGQLGLPMDQVYRDKVDRKRARGYALAEASCLAFDASVPRASFWKVFLQLTRLMAQFARRQGIDALLIAVHPKHASVYQRLMGFEQFGTEQLFPSVRNRPAVAYCLDFSRVDRIRPPCYERVFGQTIPDWELQRRRMSLEEQRRFCPVSEATGALLSLPIAC